MDLEPGRTRVHEHAETARPLAAHKLHGASAGIGPVLARLAGAVRPCDCQGSNGPAAGKRQFARCKVGHKLSAPGSPLRTASSICWARHPPRVASLRDGRPCGWFQVIPPAYPHTFRSRLSPLDLAPQRFANRFHPKPPRLKVFLRQQQDTPRRAGQDQ